MIFFYFTIGVLPQQSPEPLNLKFNISSSIKSFWLSFYFLLFLDFPDLLIFVVIDYFIIAILNLSIMFSSLSYHLMVFNDVILYVNYEKLFWHQSWVIFWFPFHNFILLVILFRFFLVFWNFYHGARLHAFSFLLKLGSGDNLQYCCYFNSHRYKFTGYFYHF